MSWWLWKIVLALFSLYMGVALALYFLQRKLVFSPNPTYVSPDDIELKGIDEVVLKTKKEGFKLFSWYAKAAPNKPTLLFFHGNGGNVANREEKFRQLMAEGYGVFMLGYRGFGGSEGKPSEEAFVKDAFLAYDYLRETIGLNETQIVIYGESIGTSVATQLAARVEAKALVLEAPMSSVTAVAQSRYPYLRVRPFLRDRFESDRHIASISMPLLIVHGKEDQVIPLEFGKALFEAAIEPKQMEVIEGAGHNDLYEHPLVEKVVRFLSSLDVELEAQD
ncbi:MAG: alpha/beta fold hydrolase [Rhizobiales bacterium]|nr:alpha/beta fold hydrolase [Hyphomicrobiales bacterium]